MSEVAQLRWPLITLIREEQPMFDSTTKVTLMLLVAPVAAFNGPTAGQDQGSEVAQSDNRTQMKTESFDHDPGWLGVNNRAARMREPVSVRQDFGFSVATGHAGGKSPGEIGGFISPAGEIAFYGKVIDPTNLDRPLAAAGTMNIGQGSTHLLLGFFNSQTVNEWRTPN